MCSPWARDWELMQWPSCNPMGKASSYQTSNNGREGEGKKIPVVQTPPQQNEKLGCSSLQSTGTQDRHCQLEQCST